MDYTATKRKLTELDAVRVVKKPNILYIKGETVRENSFINILKK